MKKLCLTLALGLIIAGQSFAQSSAVIKDYIQKYKEIAIEEMKRSGVPAAITLAQGIHETSAGQSILVVKSNNHFGIKCKSEWKGESVSHDDDARGECFRKYENPYDSYRDHSDFLATRSHYASLFKLDPTDYEAWAYGLKKAGYATNPKYPQILIKLIRDYNLQDYTLIALGEKKDASQDEIWAKNNSSKKEEVSAASIVSIETKKADYPANVFRINDTKVLFVPKGTAYLSIAYDHNVPLKRLFEFNDMPTQEIATNDQLIYLQRKRKTGASEFHTVANGESLHQIAQAEGIRLETLLFYNFLKADMQPQAGEKLYLHYQAPAMPKLVAASNVVTTVSKSDAFAKSSSEEKEEAGFILHTVQPKETVYSISKKYDVSLQDVLKWNDMESSDLRTGQQLRIKRM